VRLLPSDQIKRRLLQCIQEGRYETGHGLPTIQELARTFQVSTKTVQKAIHALRKEGVINAKRGVGLSVRSPGPRIGRGRRVGLVFPNAPRYVEQQPYPGTVIRELEAELRRSKLTLVRCPLETMERMALTDRLARLKLAGLVLFEIDNDSMILEFRELRLPMVSMDYDAYRHGVPSVVFDNAFGSFQATKHLVGLGHRGIAFLRPLLRNPMFSPSLDAVEEERLKGYRIAMLDAGLPTEIREFENQPAALRQALQELLGRRPAPTALVCVADWSARAIAREIMRMGFRVPEDLSLVGFGDYGLEIAPGRRLTSVWVDYEGMGRTAGQILKDVLEGNGPRARRAVLPARLAPGHTVSPPPAL